jgi:predicted dehydrogenase
VVTRDGGRRQAVAAAYPRVRAVDDLDQLLTPELAVDVVVVASANRSHVPLARAALDAGRAVVVDKPLAVDTEGARELVAHAESHGTLLTVFQNRRWDDDFLTLRGLVDDGSLGELWQLESRFERWRPTPRAGWRELADPAEGGGVLLDLGPHLVDQAVVLLGRVVDVHAELDVRRPGAEVPDHAFVSLTHRSGARSHLSMSSATALPGPRLRALGSTAGFVIWGLDPQEAALRAGGHPGQPGYGVRPESAWGRWGTEGDERPVPTRAGEYQTFYAELVQALRGQGPIPVDPHDALHTQAVLDAALQSHHRGTVVMVDEPG